MLGSIALAQEQFDRAASWFDASLEHFQRAGNDWGISEAQACPRLRQLLHWEPARKRQPATRRVLNKPGTSATRCWWNLALHGLAGVAAESGRPEAGARLLGAAERIISSLGAPAYPRDQPVRSVPSRR